MNLLVISYYHNDNNCVGSLRTRMLERMLPPRGINVFVLTSGNHGEELIVSGNVFSLKADKSKKSHYIYNQLKKFYRIMHDHLGFVERETFWEINSIKHLDDILKKIRPDAIFCTYPPLEAIRLGIQASIKTGLPLVVDFRDSFLVDAIEPGLKHKWRAKYKHYKSVEKYVIQNADFITAASSKIANSFESIQSSPKVKTIFNAYNPNEIVRCYSCYEAAKVNIVHTGQISASEHGTSILCLVIGIILALRIDFSITDKICFHFIGKLTFREKLLLWPLSRIGVVRIWGVVSRTEALKMQASADVLLLITKPMAKNAISGKLIEYLRLKKKILALTSGSEAEEILVKSGLGIIAAPNNSEEISKKIIMLSRREINMSEEINHEFISEFSENKAIDRFVEVLKSVKWSGCSPGSNRLVAR